MASMRYRVAPITIGLFFLGLSPFTPPDARAADALRSVATRGSSAVTVGDGGRVIRAYPAPHNSIWNSAGFVTRLPLHAVTTGGTDYFAVGDSGTVIQSTDIAGQGASWLKLESGTKRNLYGVAHGFLRMVAVGDSATILLSSSLEGGFWGRVTAENVHTDKPLRAVAGNQSFVAAVGDSGTIVSSRPTTMVIWDRPAIVPTTRNLHGICSEPEGTTGPVFWAVGEGGTILVSSVNPAGTWELQASPVSVDLHAVAMYRLLPDNVVIAIAVGDGGTIIRSTDRATWTQVDSGTTLDLYGIAYTGSGTGGGFVAVGDESTVLWSPTGVVWSGAVVPTEKKSWGNVRGAWRNPGVGR